MSFVGGHLSYTASGAALAALAPGSTAIDSFTYTVTDQYQATDTGTVAITVANPGDSGAGPVGGNGTFTQWLGEATITVSGYNNTINATLSNATLYAGAGNAR
ncbi:MAG: hypothetical protein WDN49_23245 [Acetobacteraceae bacterium]